MFNRSEIVTGLARCYDQCARQYALGEAPLKVGEFMHDQLGRFAQEIIHFNDPTELKVLDLGSGPGEESNFLRDKYKISPVCVDISAEMLAICAERGLETRREDFSHLSDLNHSIDGIIMNFSFLHVPKSESGSAMAEIHRVLRQQGVLQMVVFEGKGEGYEEKTKYPSPRFFAYYSEDELRAVVEGEFSVVYQKKLKNKLRNLLGIIGKAR